MPPQEPPSFDELNDSVNQLARVLAALIKPETEADILGRHLAPLVQRGERRHPRMFVITLALLSDCLRAAEAVIDADGEVSAAESEYVTPLVDRVVQALARERGEYSPLLGADIEQFLDHYRRDRALFGYACEDTRWIGLAICQRASHETHDGEALELYRRLQTRLSDEVCELSGVTPADAQASPRLREVFELRTRLAAPEVAVGENDDARLDAFLSDRSPQVFSSAAAPSEVWRRDPLDVDTIHSDARDAFERVLDRVSNQLHSQPAPAPSPGRRARTSDGGAGARGRILLILGESGSGKTHLMRAFRSHVHDRRRGFVGYLQLTSRSQNYAEYLLRSVIRSLDRSYASPDEERTGLALLSDTLAEAGGVISPAERSRLRADSDPGHGGYTDDLGADDLTGPLVDRILTVPGFERFDPDLLRALLYLQQQDPAINSRVFKYLCCEPLNEYDRRKLGGMASRSPDAAQRTLEELGQLMWVAAGASLVLLIDQLEDLHNLDDVEARFRRAIDVVRHLTDHVPSAVVVISCLDDLYATLRRPLSQSALDRLERDPDRVQLTSRRTVEEIEAIVGQRLAYLYEQMEVRWRPDDPIFPFRNGDLAQLANLRIRDVLDACRQHHEGSIQAGALLEGFAGVPAPAAAGTTSTPPPTPGGAEATQPPDARTSTADASAAAQAANAAQADAAAQAADAARAAERRADELDLKWDAYRENFSESPPDKDDELLTLLEHSVDALSAELPASDQLTCVRDQEFLRITTQRGRHSAQRIALAICNKDARGGGLLRQLDQLAKKAGANDALVFVRSSAFPGGGTTKTARKRAQLVRAGARTVVMHSAEWRDLMAFSAFVQEPDIRSAQAAWRAQRKPLSRIECLRTILALDEISPLLRPPPSPAAPTPAASAPSAPSAPKPAPKPAPAARQPTAPPADRSLALGHSGSLRPEPLALDLDELTRHAAFLGSTGSGKTTLALAIIEQALARGVPALLIDRKGDLCRYAQAEFWSQPEPDMERSARKQALRERVDVRLYTPGDPRGRALGLPIVPVDLADASAIDRGRIAKQAAAAVAAMMGYRQRGNDKFQVSILAKAIEMLGASSSAAPANIASIGSLIELIDRRDDALYNSLGHLAKEKYFDKLVEDLELVKQTQQHLLGAHGDDHAPATGAAGAAHTTTDELLSPGAFFRKRPDGKTPLTIISTKFLGENTTIEFWIARLAVEIARWSSKHPADSLQALVFFDEADIYMPAMSKPATKEPMQDLLKRARSAGVGVLLGTQNPGDLDYRSRENVLTWFVGRITEERNLGKLKSLLENRATSRLSRKKAGEFLLLRRGQVVELKAARALMETAQLSEDEIRAIARATRS